MGQAIRAYNGFQAKLSLGLLLLMLILGQSVESQESSLAPANPESVPSSEQLFVGKVEQGQFPDEPSDFSPGPPPPSSATSEKPELTQPVINNVTFLKNSPTSSRSEASTSQAVNGPTQSGAIVEDSSTEAPEKPPAPEPVATPQPAAGNQVAPVPVGGQPDQVQATPEPARVQETINSPPAQQADNSAPSTTNNSLGPPSVQSDSPPPPQATTESQTIESAARSVQPVQQTEQVLAHPAAPQQTISNAASQTDLAPESQSGPVGPVVAPPEASGSKLPLEEEPQRTDAQTTTPGTPETQSTVQPAVSTLDQVSVVQQAPAQAQGSSTQVLSGSGPSIDASITESKPVDEVSTRQQASAQPVVQDQTNLKVDRTIEVGQNQPAEQNQAPPTTDTPVEPGGSQIAAPPVEADPRPSELAPVPVGGQPNQASPEPAPAQQTDNSAPSTGNNSLGPPIVQPDSPPPPPPPPQITTESQTIEIAARSAQPVQPEQLLDQAAIQQTISEAPKTDFAPGRQLSSVEPVASPEARGSKILEQPQQTDAKSTATASPETQSTQSTPTVQPTQSTQDQVSRVITPPVASPVISMVNSSLLSSSQVRDNTISANGMISNIDPLVAHSSEYSENYAIDPISCGQVHKLVPGVVLNMTIERILETIGGQNCSEKLSNIRLRAATNKLIKGQVMEVSSVPLDMVQLMSSINTKISCRYDATSPSSGVEELQAPGGGGGGDDSSKKIKFTLNMELEPADHKLRSRWRHYAKQKVDDFPLELFGRTQYGPDKRSHKGGTKCQKFKTNSGEFYLELKSLKTSLSFQVTLVKINERTYTTSQSLGGQVLVDKFRVQKLYLSHTINLNGAITKQLAGGSGATMAIVAPTVLIMHDNNNHHRRNNWLYNMYGNWIRHEYRNQLSDLLGQPLAKSLNLCFLV